MRNLWDETKATANNVAAISRQTPYLVRHDGKILPRGEWFAVMGLQLWGQKVAAHLQVFFEEGGDDEKVSERTRRSWSSGESELPGRCVALLLRSSEGDRVLKWIMRGSDAAWWARHQRAERICQKLEGELAQL